jgi:hypothetical protein
MAAAWSMRFPHWVAARGGAGLMMAALWAPFELLFEYYKFALGNKIPRARALHTTQEGAYMIYPKFEVLTPTAGWSMRFPRLARG